MYTLLSIKQLITIFGGFVATFMVLILMISGDLSPISVIRSIFASITFSGIFLFLVGGTPAWRYLWKWFPQLNDWIFPDINGIWKGQQTSNWSVIDHTIKAAKQTQSTFDCEASDATLPKLLNSGMTLCIKANWLRISMKMKTDKEYSFSDTLLIVPKVNKENGRKELYYFYENITPDNKNSDESSHTGAAIVEIEKSGKELSLKGQNWTNRMWRQGKNTAGRVSFLQFSDDPKLPI